MKSYPVLSEFVSSSRRYPCARGLDELDHVKAQRTMKAGFYSSNLPDKLLFKKKQKGTGVVETIIFSSPSSSPPFTN